VGDDFAAVEDDEVAVFLPEEPQAARTTGAATARATAAGHRRLLDSER